MESYDARMARLMKEDRGRRYLAELAELAELGQSPEVDTYVHSRNITGEPSDNNRVHRANSERNSFDRMARPTWSPVKVTSASGAVTYAPASAFRATSTASKATQPTEQRETQQARRMRLLAEVGNNSDVD